MIASTCELTLTTIAAYGGAQLLGAGVSAVSYLASVEGRLMTTMTNAYIGQQINNPIFNNTFIRELNYGAFGLMNGITPTPPMANGFSEGLGWLVGWRISENWDKIKMTLKNFKNK